MGVNRAGATYALEQGLHHLTLYAEEISPDVRTKLMRGDLEIGIVTLGVALIMIY
jgi:hypothetical protein